MASNNQHATVPYDALNEPPVSPRLEEFGRPAPTFLNSDSRSSSSTTVGYRASEYGSIAALQTPKFEVTPPEGTEVPMRQLSPVPRASKDLEEKNELYAAPRTQTKRKALLWGLVAAGAVILVVAIAVPVAIFSKKNHSQESGSSGGSSSDAGHSGSGTSHSGNNQPTVVTSGGDGSIVTKSDGTTFVYNNTFGGMWVYDPANPLNNSARAQSWSPPLSEEWRWGVDQVFG